MKEKTKQVKTWEELVDLIENVNPFKNTLVLTGWINRLEGNKTVIETLVFSIRPVEILKMEIIDVNKPVKCDKNEDEFSQSEGETPESKDL